MVMSNLKHDYIPMTRNKHRLPLHAADIAKPRLHNAI